MKTVGQHLVVDLSNLDRAICLDGKAWVDAFVKSAEQLQLNVISKYSHIFEHPKRPGLTAYVLLDSSHFSVHTYADTCEAAVDLFACTEDNLMQAFTWIRETLKIKETSVVMRKELTRFNSG